VDIRGAKSAIANYFVITTAFSIPQINTISLRIEQIFTINKKALRKDGVSHHL
jgi:ribosomal silencing factor RsfS